MGSDSSSDSEACQDSEEEEEEEEGEEEEEEEGEEGEGRGRKRKRKRNHFLWRNSNALPTSAVKFEYKLFSIDLCPEKFLYAQARAYASESPSKTCWQQPLLPQPTWKHLWIPLECVPLRIGAECFNSS